ncbi:MAG TPA: ABC transporter substrate-binding protein [Gammaproteobacteria bacterium]|nr:ABC transporter substrate-binding protein [Gammaproteobacteria bacterium]
MWKKLVLAVAVVGLSVPAFASSQPPKAQRGPEEMVKSVTGQLLSEVQHNKESLKKNPDAVYKLVDRIVLPHFDFQYMTQLVMGRYWRQASDQQKKAVTDAFRQMLVRTYSNALLSYDHQKLDYKPYRGKQGATDATVNMNIVPEDGQPIPVSYRLYLDDQGHWMVYDVTVDNISLVTNYRTTFADVIRSDGIDGLIRKLHNKQIKSVKPTQHG